MSATTTSAFVQISTLDGPQVLRVEDDGSSAELELGSLVFVTAEQDVAVAENLRDEDSKETSSPKHEFQ